LIRIKDKLVGKGIEVIDSQVIRKPIVKIEITDDVILSKIGNFIDAIEDLEDVQKVYSNIA